MPYATAQDLIDRFGQDEANDLAGAFGAGVIDRALADAHALVDGYVGRRHALPLASAPAVLVRITCDVARYNAWAGRVNDQVAAGYRLAIAQLQAIARGELVLDVPGSDPAPAGSQVMVSSGGRVFPAGSLDDY